MFFSLNYYFKKVNYTNPHNTEVTFFPWWSSIVIRQISTSAAPCILPTPLHPSLRPTANLFEPKTINKSFDNTLSFRLSKIFYCIIYFKPEKQLVCLDEILFLILKFRKYGMRLQYNFYSGVILLCFCLGLFTSPVFWSFYIITQFRKSF